MKKLIFIVLFLAGCSLWASADQASKDTTKKDTSKVAAGGHAGKTQGNGSTKVSGDQSGTKNGDQAPAKTTAKTCPDASSSDIRVWVGYALILLILGVFVGTACFSSLLRDPVTNPATFMAAAHAMPKYATEQDINKIPKSFSLARTQLAIWTVVIAVSYIFLELCRYKYSAVPMITVDKTLLALMGISAATTAAGSIIDSNGTQTQQDANGPSVSFFKDILSDQNGINIHRFQNVVWTMVAVTLYLCQIPDVTCGSLPTLDSTLIALTGISSATYLGLKINENKS